MSNQVSISFSFHLQIISRYLYFNETIAEAVAAHRIHHQLIPMRIDYEKGLKQSIVDGLDKVGHKMFEGEYASGFSSVTAIGCGGAEYAPVYDPRRQGSSMVF